MPKKFHNPHPGEILKTEFIDEIGLSQNAFAHAINVPPNRIHAIVKGARDITVDNDLRLSRFFGLSEGYWLRLQNSYDLRESRRALGKSLMTITQYKAESSACT